MTDLRLGLSLTVVALALGGCASGQPLSAVIPDEHHLRAETSALTGEYAAGESAGIAQQDLTWTPVDLDREDARALLRHTARVDVSPGDLKPTGSYELTVEVTPELDPPSATSFRVGLRSVSAALHVLDYTPRLSSERQLEAIIANLDRVPPDLATALRGQPHAVAALQPAADGVLRHAFTVGADDLRWGPAWFGRAADVLVSIVLRDDAGRVRRVVLGAGFGVLEEDAGSPR